MKQKFVIAPYDNSTVAMYKSTDFRVKDVEIIEGSYKKDNSVKGTFNGAEIGVFTALNGDKYIVFVDWTAKKILK